MLKNRPYSVPQNYFEDLQAKLSAIPLMPEDKPTRWQYFQPYLALVASFCLALAIGMGLQKKLQSLPDSSESNIYEQLIYADMIPHSEPYTIYNIAESTTTDDELLEEDIIAYLIETGTSIEMIDYFSK